MPSKTHQLVDEQNLEQSSVISDIGTLVVMWSCTLLPVVAVGVVGYLIATNQKSH